MGNDHQGFGVPQGAFQSALQVLRIERGEALV
jgi:hypothetical protein